MENEIVCILVIQMVWKTFWRMRLCFSHLDGVDNGLWGMRLFAF